MKNVSSIILVLFSFIAFSQTSDALKKEQQLLERKITDTQLLLSKSQSKSENSLNALQVLKNQIRHREELLRNFDNQVRSGEIKIQNKEQQIADLKARISKMKSQYKKLLVYAYKHRNKYGRMMFIFASKSYNEALRRNRYIKGMEDLRKKQFEAIRLNQEFIRNEIVGINEERKLKIVMLEDKKKERDEIEKDKLAQEEIYQQLKREESAILEKLKRSQENQAVLKRQIDNAIRKEIELAEAKARRQREEEEARRKAELEAKRIAEQKANNQNQKEVVEVPKVEVKTEPVFEETSEVKLIVKNFSTNKGRLPWPVDKGTITEKYGTNPHPTLKNVKTENNGIDISAPKNSQVRAVFEGEVTIVMEVGGAGKTVIVKHGSYRTVYSNLKEVYVSKGDKIKTKKVIGSLLGSDSDDLSVLNFQIRLVSGADISTLNPSLWISQ